MRSSLLALPFLFAAGCAHSGDARPAASAAEVPVSGRLLESKPFCGGSGPTFVRDPAEPKPAAVELLVRRGTRNTGEAPFTRVTPGPDGRFEVALPPGEWCFVDADRHAAEPPASTSRVRVDAGCWRERWARCLHTVTVAGQPVDAGDVLLVRYCPWADPCLKAIQP